MDWEMREAKAIQSALDVQLLESAIGSGDYKFFR